MGFDLGELFQRHAALLLPLVTMISVAGIVFCSIMVLAILVERSMVLRRKRIMPSGFLEQVRRYWYRGDVKAALAYCDEHPVAIARLVKAGLVRHTADTDEIEKALEAAGQFEASGVAPY